MDNKTQPEPSLYHKYRVEKTDGTPIDIEARYFVLRYDAGSGDLLAREILHTYAQRSGLTQLVEEIERQERIATQIDSLPDSPQPSNEEGEG